MLSSRGSSFLVSSFDGTVGWIGKWKLEDGGGNGSSGGGSGREVLFFLSFNLFNPFLITKLTPGGPGAFFSPPSPPPPQIFAKFYFLWIEKNSVNTKNSAKLQS